MDPGGAITLHEKKLVPGDYVHYEILYETETYQGPPTVKHAPPIPLQVEGGKRVEKEGGVVQFGADPHKIKVDNISYALSEIMKTIPNTQLTNVRDWLGT